METEVDKAKYRYQVWEQDTLEILGTHMEMKRKQIEKAETVEQVKIAAGVLRSLLKGLLLSLGQAINAMSDQHGLPKRRPGRPSNEERLKETSALERMIAEQATKKNN